MSKAFVARVGFVRRTGFSALTRSIANKVKIASLDREDARPTPASSQSLALERRRELGRFYVRFDAYVEILCHAAQFGTVGKREAAYQSERAYLLKTYPALGPKLAAYLRPQTEDVEILQASGIEGGDAIDALLALENLAEFVAADDGTMISRIERAREALILYGEQLRRLAAR